jgi:multidrug transporter EmrE-like cation transporter
MIWAALLVAIVLVEVAAMVSLTRSGRTGNLAFAIMGVLGYASIGVLFAVLMEETNGTRLAFVNAAWNASTVVFTTLVAVLAFGERLLWYQWVAIGMAVVAVVLLSIGEYAQENARAAASLV